nr:hypothetical protein [Gemmatimonadales bacterium]
MTGPGPGGLTNPQAINHLISATDGATMTARFRGANPRSVRGWLFDRSAFDSLLGQASCAGIRIYRGLKDDGTENLVIVGTDATGNDLVSAMGSGLVAEIGWPCPPMCGTTSILGAT